MSITFKKRQKEMKRLWHLLVDGSAHYQHLLIAMMNSEVEINR